MGQNTNVRDYQNRNQENNANTALVETETKANVLTKATDFLGKHKEGVLVGGVLITGYVLRKPIVKAVTWFWKNTGGRIFGKKNEVAPAPAEDAAK